MVEPLNIWFHRSAGPGRPELSGTFREFTLTAEDERTWLGTERLPVHRPQPTGRVAVYEVVFRRGGETRRVILTEDDLDARRRPLVEQLISLCERH